MTRANTITGRTAVADFPSGNECWSRSAEESATEAESAIDYWCDLGRSSRKVGDHALLTQASPPEVKSTNGHRDHGQMEDPRGRWPRIPHLAAQKSGGELQLKRISSGSGLISMLSPPVGQPNKNALSPRVSAIRHMAVKTRHWEANRSILSISNRDTRTRCR